MLKLLAKGKAENERKNKIRYIVWFSLHGFVYLFRLFLPAVACFLLAFRLSCESLANALGYYGASLLLGESLAPAWPQLGSIGPSNMAVSLDALLGLSWACLSISWPLPGLFWASFGPPESPLGRRSPFLTTCGTILVHVLAPHKRL